LPVYWEGKFSKQLKSFNLTHIADHQAKALTEVNASVAISHTWIVYGVHVGRGDFRIWIFDWEFIRPRIASASNIKKKELEALPYHAVKKQRIELDRDKIIGDV
jgi:penicillin-binding protein-related factor A (putative recombinase)